jgi:hypothetical protein
VSIYLYQYGFHLRCHSVLSCVAEYQTKYKRYVKRESRPFNPEKSRAHRRRLAKKKKSTSQTDVADQVTAMEVDMPLWTNHHVNPLRFQIHLLQNVQRCLTHYQSVYPR